MPHAVALALAALLAACADTPTSWPVEPDAGADADPCGPPPDVDERGYLRVEQAERFGRDCWLYISPDGVCEQWVCRVACNEPNPEIERCYIGR